MGNNCEVCARDYPELYEIRPDSIQEIKIKALDEEADE